MSKNVKLIQERVKATSDGRLSELFRDRLTSWLECFDVSASLMRRVRGVEELTPEAFWRKCERARKLRHRTARERVLFTSQCGKPGSSIESCLTFLFTNLIAKTSFSPVGDISSSPCIGRPRTNNKHRVPAVLNAAAAWSNMVKLNNLLHRKTPVEASGKETKTSKKAWKKAVEDDASQLSELSHSSSDDDEVREQVSVGNRSHSESSQQFEKKLRAKHSKGCKSMSNGDYATALEEFESILSELLTRYGERHERVGAALHNVAIANLRAGSLDDAMDAIEEAIKIRSRALGRSHPRVTVSFMSA